MAIVSLRRPRFRTASARRWAFAPSTPASPGTRRTEAWRGSNVLAHQPRLVVVELGVNDAFGQRSRDGTVANLRAITRRVRAQGAAVVLLHTSIPGVAGDGYRRDLREIAKAEGIQSTERRSRRHPSYETAANPSQIGESAISNLGERAISCMRP
jgi:hypothetical protein